MQWTVCCKYFLDSTINKEWKNVGLFVSLLFLAPRGEGQKAEFGKGKCPEPRTGVACTDINSDMYLYGVWMKEPLDLPTCQRHPYPVHTLKDKLENTETKIAYLATDKKNYAVNYLCYETKNNHFHSLVSIATYTLRKFPTQEEVNAIYRAHQKNGFNVTFLHRICRKAAMGRTSPQPTT